jgi:sigma-E factor negative regulatory protein RseC
MNKFIEHEGIVQALNGGKISVKIARETACGDCQAKGSCSAAAGNDSIIEAENSGGEDFGIGEKVKVAVYRNSGLRAVFLAFVIPFLLILSVLFVLKFTSVSETAAGLAAIAVLAPYYLLLRVLRHKLNRQFRIFAKKYDD